MFEGKARSIFGMEVQTSSVENTSQQLFPVESGEITVRSGSNANNNRFIHDRKVVARRRCRTCQKIFINQKNYLAHCKLHHKLHKERKDRRLKKNVCLQQEVFPCKFCHTNIIGLSGFVNHMKSHRIYEDTNYHGKFSTGLHQTDSNKVAIGAIESLNLDLVESNQHQNRHSAGDDNAMNLQEQMIVTQAQSIVGEVMTDLNIPSSLITNASMGGAHVSNSHANHQQPQQHNSFSGADGLHVEIPTHVKALFFHQSNSSNTGNPNIDFILKNMVSIQNKLDIIMKHLNIPLDEEGNPLPPPTSTIEVHQPAAPTNQQEKNMQDVADEEAGTTVLLEGFPPSYSIVQAAKEQQQQEFYALTLSGRQAQQVFKTEANTAIATSPNDLKPLKVKGMDLWVPASSHYLSQIATLTESQPEESNELTIAIPTTTTNTNTVTLPSAVVDKIFVESRSRANFAKNLTFAIFAQEERTGKNCTGRVFGKAQHKGQLDPLKLCAVKEATFRKYPCNPNLVDITWRKECITAIDSGLRNENRSTTMKAINTHQHHQHQSLVDVTNTDVQVVKQHESLV